MNRDYDIVGDENYDKYGLLAFSRELYQNSRFSHKDKGFHYIATGMNVSPYTTPQDNPNQMSVLMLDREMWENDAIPKLRSPYEILSEDIHHREE